MRRAAFLLIVLIAAYTAASGQDLPSKIRGYKVQKVDLTVAAAGDAAAAGRSPDILVKLDSPTIAEMGLLSAVIEIRGEFSAVRHRGRIDLLSFRDVAVNGIAVEVDEYTPGFTFDKGQWQRLQQPVRIRLSYTKGPQVLAKKLFVGEKELTVTGTAFAFGEFRRFGMAFKRVVPIKFSLKIKNPLSTT